MAKRILLLSSPAYLSLHHGLLCIQRRDSPPVALPVSDIECLVVDNTQSTITTALLAALAKEGVSLVCSGGRHEPCSLTLPVTGCSRPLASLRRQLSMSAETNDALWAAVCRQKILNQAYVLDAFSLPSEAVSTLASETLPGDSSFCEARAARLYFSAVLPGGESRRDSRFTAALDYGYAVLRSLVARSLVGHGWSCCLGIHHRGPTNPFNLADDLIEPFRPVVDLVVFGNGICSPLDTGDKALLAAVHEKGCVVAGRTMAVSDAVEACVSSLGNAAREQDSNLLLLPSFPPNASPWEDA